MVDSNLKIRQINFSDKEFLNIKKIRKTIFSDEMGISELELFDKFDEASDHFLFLYQNSVIGSVRLRQIENNIKLERMAIILNFEIRILVTMLLDKLLIIIEKEKLKKLF